MSPDEALRLECLKLAVAMNGIDPVAAAKEFEAFATGRSANDAEARLANVAAALSGGPDAS